MTLREAQTQRGCDNSDDNTKAGSAPPEMGGLSAAVGQGASRGKGIWEGNFLFNLHFLRD